MLQSEFLDLVDYRVTELIELKKIFQQKEIKDVHHVNKIQR